MIGVQSASSPQDVSRQIRVCRELLGFLQAELLPNLPASDRQREHWGIVLALSGGATTTYEAAISLVEGGFGYQAAMLNRSLFETMVDCYWTVINAQLAVQRLREHTLYMPHVSARTSAKFPRQFGDLQPPEPLDADDEKRLSDLFSRGRGSWTGLNLYKRVDVISERWPVGVAREHLFFFRDIANSINNYLLHPTPWGMARMTSPFEDRSGAGAGRRVEVGPNQAFRSEALFGSFWIASSMTRLLLEECDDGVDEFEDGLYARGIRAFVSIDPEARRETGRNDPCPCGSGLKFKRCHDE